MALLVLPLYVPTLIYGIAAISTAQIGAGGFQGSFLIVTALSLGSIVLGPLAAAAALRIRCNSGVLICLNRDLLTEKMRML